MHLNRRRFLGGMVAGSAAAAFTLPARPVSATVASGSTPALLPQALAALNAHGQVIPNRDLIGIVDFSAPSRSARFDIVDVVGGRVLGRHLVAHGSGSDPANSGWVQRFSNLPGSNASSKGSFVTGQHYYGRHGRSRRLMGLEAENSAALARNIVIHGASYVTPQMAEDVGRIGRSQGCFAVSTSEIADVLELLGPGRLLFAAK